MFKIRMKTYEQVPQKAQQFLGEKFLRQWGNIILDGDISSKEGFYKVYLFNTDGEIYTLIPRDCVEVMNIMEF